LILGIQDLAKLRHGAIRIKIWNNYESDSGIQAIVTFRIRYCGHLVLWRNEWGLLKKTNFKHL